MIARIYFRIVLIQESEPFFWKDNKKYKKNAAKVFLTADKNQIP
jgi:hypothetical protein